MRSNSARKVLTNLSAGLAAALAALGCGDNEPFVGHISRSEFFVYHERSDAPLCPTLLSLLDEHVQ